MLKAFKYRLYPNEEQKVLLAKHFGVCRFVYNKALDIKNKFYKENSKNLSIFEISGTITKLKEELIWLKEVNSQSIQSSLRNLDIAFINFFKKRSKFPKFKNKFSHQSFACPQNCNIDFENKRFFLPKFKNGIHCVFHREFEGKIKTCTISKNTTGKYFVSILVEDGCEELENNKIADNQTQNQDPNKILGIDLGIEYFAIFSNGQKIENPKPLSWKLRKLKISQRKLSKKKLGSKNREKAKKIVAIIHEKIANFRLDFLHKLSKKIVENQDYNTVSIETLDIKKMIQDEKFHKSLSRNILDCGWGIFQNILEYKLKNFGKTLIKIDKFFPSSKICSHCQCINSGLELKDRNWKCENCSSEHDRDINAAINIRNAAINIKNFALNLLKIGRDTPDLKACGDR